MIKHILGTTVLFTIATGFALVEDPCKCVLLLTDGEVVPQDPMEVCSFTGSIGFQYENAFDGQCAAGECIGPPSECNLEVTVTVAGSSDCWIVLRHQGQTFGRGFLGGFPPLAQFAATTKVELECGGDSSVVVKFAGGSVLAFQDYWCEPCIAAGQ